MACSVWSSDDSDVRHYRRDCTRSPAVGDTRGGSGGHDRWEQRERHDVPGPRSTRQWANTVAVVGELELAAHEPVRELAGLDVERADVAGDRFALALGVEVACGRSTSNTP